MEWPYWHGMTCEPPARSLFWAGLYFFSLQWRNKEGAVLQRPRESAGTGCLSAKAGPSCDLQLQAQGETVWAFSHFSVSSVAIHSSRYCNSCLDFIQREQDIDSCLPVVKPTQRVREAQYGSQRQKAVFYSLISRYVDSDQHHSNYLSHLNELDTEIATLVICTAPFIGKFLNARYQFNWVGKLHSFVDMEMP